MTAVFYSELCSASGQKKPVFAGLRFNSLEEQISLVLKFSFNLFVGFVVNNKTVGLSPAFASNQFFLNSVFLG